ncbi:MAG: peptidoglycan DD-metalloendopeptidase family protein [Coprobacter sp.]|nr:peptidoglycan DD-metalloendopeptidase family protein [Coprobacter sp.]
MRRFLYILFGLVLMSASAGAQSKQIKNLEKQRKEAQKLIEETRKMITSTGKSMTSSLNQLNLLRAEISTHREIISLLNKEINEINREQKAVSDTIYRLTKELEKKKKGYAKAMQQIYRNRSGYETMMFVFSSSSLAQSYRRIRYLQEYSAWRKKEAEEIKVQQAVLEEKKVQLNKVMQEKTALLNERTNASKALQSKETAQANMVADLKKKEKSLKATLTKQQQQANALNKKIEQLIAEEARKAAEEARKKSGSSSEERRSQTQGGYAMTKEEWKLSGDFEKNKGKLPFPLSGRYMIVGRFGEQQHPDLKYVKINNSGIDLQTTPGTQARSVFDGVVTAVFTVEGDSRSVIIRHGNYLTIYSNLSQVFVKKGQKVTTRQAIGKIYSDPQDDNRTVLGFQLWKEKTKLNPEPWLAK